MSYHYDNYGDNPHDDCPMCLRYMRTRKTVEFYDCCNHEVCNGCFIKYVNNKIADGCPLIACPLCHKPNLNNDSRRSRDHIDWLMDYVKPMISRLNYNRLQDMMNDHCGYYDNYYDSDDSDDYDDYEDEEDDKYECPICNRDMGSRLTVEMVDCDHEVCNGCFLKYVNSKITDGCPLIACPVCLKPDLKHDSKRNRDHIVWLLDYVKPMISRVNHDRLKVIMKEHQDMFDPGFLRCPECTGGFICRRPTGNRTAMAKCPHCERTVHVDANGNIVNNNNEAAAAGAGAMPPMLNNDQYAWFKCSRCKATVTVEDFDCLHMACRCSHESCRGCNQPFVRNANSADCQRRRCTLAGLHCHHPRYCAYYLRDFGVADLQRLLRNAGVPIEAPAPAKVSRCTGHTFDANGNAGRCTQNVVFEAFKCCNDHSHYHLSDLIRRHRVDPLPMLGLQFCVQEVGRLRLPMPARGPHVSDATFRAACERVLLQQGPPLEW